MALHRQIPPEGLRCAAVVLIGEAGGREEAEQGRPFVGPTGALLEELLRDVGLTRAQVRLDNVVQRRPSQRSNDLRLIPKAELHQWKLDCQRRVEEDYRQAQVIVPLGELALQAVTGKTRISRWRGSLLEGYRPQQRVIPTFHPAYTFRDPIALRAIQRDLQRARAWLDGTIVIPERRYRFRPTIEEVELYASLVCRLGESDLMTLDVETPGYLDCVGFSYDPHEALCVPTTKRYWKDPRVVQRAWRCIRAMCQSRVPKVLMHGLFDAYWLWMIARLPIANWRWDLMGMHHCLQPNEPHNLAYIVSMYMDWYVFWKDEAKDPESVQRYAKDIDALHAYNCMDCCAQRGVFEPLYAAMDERNVVAFYQEHYGMLLPHLLALMTHGFRVDKPLRQRRAAQAKAMCIRVEDALEQETGQRLYAVKDFSRTALLKLLYEQLKLPKQYHIDPKGTQTLTADVFTIQKLTHRYPKKMGVIGPLILTHRKAQKELTFYDPKKVDSDGRFRSSYGFDPATARLSSSKNPMGTGDNAQNQDRRVRDTFLADHGCVIVRVDMSQAESRIVDMLTLHPEHVARARSMPWERDVHAETAAVIFTKQDFGISPSEQRYIAKRAKYAGLYDITGDELSRQFTKEGMFLDPKTCQQIIDRAVEEPIRDWQRRTRAEVMRNGILGNSWGFTLDFAGMRLERETYKKAYAFRPQSEVAFWMHRWGFLALALVAKDFGAAINAHVHDELVVSVPPARVWEVMQFLRAHLERPRHVAAAGELVIPCTWAIGRTWEGGTKFDRWPEHNAVVAACALVGES